MSQVLAVPPVVSSSSSSSGTKIDTINGAIDGLESTNVTDVIQGLNFLLQKSNEYNEQLIIESNPRLLMTLGNLLEIVNPMCKVLFDRFQVNDDKAFYQNFQFANNNNNNMTISLQETGSIEWKNDLLENHDFDFDFLANHLDSNQFLTSILRILRNLSFEIANETFLAFHCGIMKHIVSVLIASIKAPHLLENLNLVFDLLMNIANRIDFSCKKRAIYSSGYLEDNLPPPQQVHQSSNTASASRLASRDVLKFRLSYEMSSSSTLEYSLAIRSLLPIISALISNKTSLNRFYLLKSLELLNKLCSSPENQSYLSDCPKAFLEQLLLHLQPCTFSILENHPLDNILPDHLSLLGDPMGKSRPGIGFAVPIVHQQAIASMTINLTSLNNPANQSNSTYESVIVNNPGLLDQTDVEVRDAVLEVLLLLCRFSDRNRATLGSLPHIVRILYNITSTSNRNDYYSITKKQLGSASGSDKPSNTIPSATQVPSATEILVLLSKTTEAANQFRAMRTEFICTGCADESLAEILCNRPNLNLLLTTKDQPVHDPLALAPVVDPTLVP